MCKNKLGVYIYVDQSVFFSAKFAVLRLYALTFKQIILVNKQYTGAGRKDLKLQARPRKSEQVKQESQTVKGAARQAGAVTSGAAKQSGVSAFSMPVSQSTIDGGQILGEAGMPDKFLP